MPDGDTIIAQYARLEAKLKRWGLDPQDRAEIMEDVGRLVEHAIKRERAQR